MIGLLRSEEPRLDYLFLLRDPTMTSSASTNLIRRSLQALPFPPSDDRLGALRASCFVKY